MKHAQEHLAEYAREVQSRTLQVPYVGRLVWRRFLSDVTEIARRERLEFNYEVKPRVLSVRLTVTVYGESTAVARFENMVERLLCLYRPSSIG